MSERAGIRAVIMTLSSHGWKKLLASHRISSR